MVTKELRRASILLASAFIFTILISCTKHTYDPDYDPYEFASCEGCHTSYAHLKEVYSPDTVAPAGGCGGEAPHFEPYDRVYLDPENGYQDFKATSHYNLGCTGCHNGNNNTDDKNEAHSGDFIKHPSMAYEEKCGECHKFITNRFTTNIHHGVGQKRKVAMRDGLAGPDDFHNLPEHQIEGYNANCATCHGTCGNCHVNRPPIGGGGLMNGHSFTPPDWRKTCVTCHTSRGGHGYLGVAPGTIPDIHYTYPAKNDTIHYDPAFEGKADLKYTCLDCHDVNELHGDGAKADQRYAYGKLPECEECHTDGANGKPLAEANSYHQKHYTDFNCHVCHSQDYNSCGSCHVHGEGARLPSHLDFKIAKNPIPDVKPGYTYALVRRTPGAPDNFDLYTGENYKDFDVFPIFNYTTPHNIQKWTSRTNKSGVGSCGKNCHFRVVGNDTINKNLYLLKENLVEEWEKSSTEWMTMDDVLLSK